MPTSRKRQNQMDMPPNAGSILVSFLLTSVFGAVTLAPLLELTDAAPLLICALSGSSHIFDAAQGIAMIILSLIWFVLFYLLWHKLEYADGYKRMFIKTAKWTGITVAVYIIAFFGHALIESL